MRNHKARARRKKDAPVHRKNASGNASQDGAGHQSPAAVTLREYTPATLKFKRKHRAVDVCVIFNDHKILSESKEAITFVSALHDMCKMIPKYKDIDWPETTTLADLISHFMKYIPNKDVSFMYHDPKAGNVINPLDKKPGFYTAVYAPVSEGAYLIGVSSLVVLEKRSPKLFELIGAALAHLEEVNRFRLWDTYAYEARDDMEIRIDDEEDSYHDHRHEQVAIGGEVVLEDDHEEDESFLESTRLRDEFDKWDKNGVPLQMLSKVRKLYKKYPLKKLKAAINSYRGLPLAKKFLQSAITVIETKEDINNYNFEIPGEESTYGLESKWFFNWRSDDFVAEYIDTIFQAMFDEGYWVGARLLRRADQHPDPFRWPKEKNFPMLAYKMFNNAEKLFIHFKQKYE